MNAREILRAQPTVSLENMHYRANDTKLATNPLHRYCADPNLTIFDNRYFLYCTDDGVEDWKTTGFSVYVSDDLARWERYPALDLRDVPWWNGEDGAWAPTIVKNGNGDYIFLFVAGSQIGAAISKTPYGPFEPMPLPIVNKGSYDCHTIDPGVFIDDDGSRYFLWGNSKACLSPFDDDCLDFDREHVKICIPGDFREAIWVHKRHGIYYASWSENDARDPEYCVKYSMGISLAGPWSEPRPLLEQDSQHGLYATGHHNIVNIPGTDEWLIAYHRFAYCPSGRWSGGDGCHREIVFAPLVHNADGTLEQVRPHVGSYVRPLTF
jgi:beta-xylosidase